MEGTEVEVEAEAEDYLQLVVVATVVKAETD
jgi:hypothetical protein